MEFDFRIDLFAASRSENSIETMARGKVEPREIPSIFHGGAAGIFSRKNKRREGKERKKIRGTVLH